MRFNQDWPLFAVDFILGKSQWFKAWMSLTKPKSMRDLNYFSSGVKKKKPLSYWLMITEIGIFFWGGAFERETFTFNKRCQEELMITFWLSKEILQT